MFGPALAAGDSESTHDADIISKLSLMGKSEIAQANAYHDEMIDDYNKKKAEKMTGEVCDVCQTPLYSDPGNHELGIYLHALRYADAGGKWSYETELPEWALPPAGTEGPVKVDAEKEPIKVAEEKMEELETSKG